MQTINPQKYKKIRLKPHNIGCLKSFFIHSKNAKRQTIEIVKRKIQKLWKPITKSKGHNIATDVMNLVNNLLNHITKSSINFPKFFERMYKVFS